MMAGELKLKLSLFVNFTLLNFYFKKYVMYTAIAAESVALSLCRQHGLTFNLLLLS